MDAANAAMPLSRPAGALSLRCSAARRRFNLQGRSAWIERVQIAYNGGTLTDRGLAPLRPYLVPLAQEDRVSALRILLSLDARNFLAEIRARWGKAMLAD